MSVNPKPAAKFIWETETVSRNGMRCELFAVFEDSWRIRVAFIDKPEGERWQSHCNFRDGYALFDEEGGARYDAEQFVTQWWNRICGSSIMAVT